MELKHTGAALYRVSDVLKPDFARSWHEAVAIVQEVASQLNAGLPVPAPEDLSFTEDGNLEFGFGTESSDRPVVILGRMLDALIEGLDAPAGLRQLAEENRSDPPAHATVASFCLALSFYERPGRMNDLRAVAGRLAAVGAARNADAEVELLREKLEAAGPKVSDTLEQRRKWPRYAIPAAAVVVALLVVAITLWNGASSRQKGLLTQEAAERVLAQGLSSALNWLGGAGPHPTSDSTMTVVEQGGAPTQPKPSTTARQSGSFAGLPASAGVSRGGIEGPPSAAATTPILTPPVTASAAITQRTNGSSPDSVTTSPPSIEAQPRIEASSGRLYTVADREVRPPAWVRPQLPTPTSPDLRAGYFDLIVNETGAVESVRLISPEGRYHDRILVAAAKAWIFRPATIGGIPVRYRMRIPITNSGPR